MGDAWSRLIAAYRARHGLTQTELAQSLSVTQQTVSRWESGNQTPDAKAQQLLRSVIGLTALSTESAWRQRVTLSWGVEALFDRSWRCIAVSERMRRAGLSPERLEGKTFGDLPAARPLVEFIAGTAFFQGGVRVVRACPKHDSLAWGVEVWAVTAGNDEVLAQFVLHPRASNEARSLKCDLRPSVIEAMLEKVSITDLVVVPP